MRRLLSRCFVAVWCAFTLNFAAWGQLAIKRSSDVTMSYPLFDFGKISPMRIARIDRDSRQAHLTFGTQQNIYSPISQGDVVLLLQNEETSIFTHAVRAKVIEQLEKGDALFEFGTEAARLLTECPVMTIVPFEGRFQVGKFGQYPVSTRRLRELPEVMAITLKNKDSSTDPVKAAKQAVMRTRSVNNLRQITLAMNDFRNRHGHYPPAVIYGPNGEPWHSWRVLLLPYLGRNDLYGQYDFTKPWNSQENKAVRETVMEVYKDPVHGNPGEAVTHYAVLVGDEAMFKPEGAKISDPADPLKEMKAGSRTISQIHDGSAKTLAVVPVADDRKIPWTKPEDIVFGPDFPRLGEPGGIAAPYDAPAGKGHVVPMAFADGPVQLFLDTMDMETLRAMITFRARDFARNRDKYVLSESRPISELRIIEFVKTPAGAISAVIE